MKLGQIVYKGKTKKGREIVIRYPKRSDTRILLDYINNLSKEKTFITLQGEQMTLKEEKIYMKNFFDKMAKNKAIKLLVLTDKKLIGESDITLKEKIENHIGILSITVLKEYRGEGVGKLLMELLQKEAKNHIKDLRIITLGCFANNDAACAMYEKFGFQKYAFLPQGIKYKGNYVDRVYFYKNIK